MTVALWRIATDTPDDEAHDLSGKGAGKTGGRWNRPGRLAVYASGSIALACLETTVHLNLKGLPLNRFLVQITVPDEAWERRTVHDNASLPVGWSAIPAGTVSLSVGDQWLLSGPSLLLQVPSVIVPEESNVVINPAHPDVSRLKAVKLRPWFYDARMPDRR